MRGKVWSLVIGNELNIIYGEWFAWGMYFLDFVVFFVSFVLLGRKVFYCRKVLFFERLGECVF